MQKKLYKNRSNRMLMGVCAGFADFFGVDVTLIRLGWAIFSLLGGSGILLYILCILIMPDNPGY